MVGISVPIAGNEESSEGKVVSIAGRERSASADDPTDGNPVSKSKDGMWESIAGKAWSIDEVTFGAGADGSVPSCGFPLFTSWFTSWLDSGAGCGYSDGGSLIAASP